MNPHSDLVEYPQNSPVLDWITLLSILLIFPISSPSLYLFTAIQSHISSPSIYFIRYLGLDTLTSIIRTD